MTLLQELLAAVPDEPGWVDTRGVLLERPELFGDLEGWVALRPDRRLLIAAGDPSPRVILAARAAAHSDAEAVATGRAISRLESAWDVRATRAIIHEVGLHGLSIPADLPEATLLAPGAPLDHLHAEWQREIGDLLGRRPIGVVLEGDLPVSVCLPTLVTEKYWDVSIETVEGYRCAGRAAATFLRVEREMRSAGLEPVWGAAQTNPASLALAVKLGFVPTAEVAWFESCG